MVTQFFGDVAGRLRAGWGLCTSGLWCHGYCWLFSDSCHVVLILEQSCTDAMTLKL